MNYVVNNLEALLNPGVVRTDRVSTCDDLVALENLGKQSQVNLSSLSYCLA